MLKILLLSECITIKDRYLIPKSEANKIIATKVHAQKRPSRDKRNQRAFQKAKEHSGYNISLSGKKCL